MPFGLGFFAVAGAGAAGSYDLLETQVLTGSQSSVTFSNLNSSYGSTYKHLQLRLTLRSDLNQTYEETAVTLNADTGSNYTDHYLAANGSTVFSGGDTTGSYAYTQAFSIATGNANASGIFGVGVIDFLDAFQTTKNKTIRTLGGRLTADGEKRITLSSGLWLSTNAITSIKIAPRIGSNWITGSRLSLYGIKGA